MTGTEPEPLRVVCVCEPLSHQVEQAGPGRGRAARGASDRPGVERSHGCGVDEPGSGLGTAESAQALRVARFWDALDAQRSERPARPTAECGQECPEHERTLPGAGRAGDYVEHTESDREVVPSKIVKRRSTKDQLPRGTAAYRLRSRGWTEGIHRRLAHREDPSPFRTSPRA